MPGVIFRKLLDEGAGQEGDISGAGEMIGLWEPHAILEMGVGHAELGGCLVHAVGKSRLRAGDALCESDTGVIPRLDDHAFKKVLNRNGRSPFRKHS